MLRLDQIALKLGRFALELDVELSGRIIGVFGPSGSGKTTLLELIAGLKRPDRGSIQLRGEYLVGGPERVCLRPEQRRIGYVPQDLALFPHLSVRQNLLFGRPARAEPAQHFHHLVERLELKPLLEARPGGLSGGEKQRVALGRALMTEPKLLLLDEPLANLDRPLSLRLLGLIREIAAEFDTPIMHVTHNANELAQLADEVILLENGRVASQGPFATLFEPAPEPIFVTKVKGAKAANAAKAPGSPGTDAK